MTKRFYERPVPWYGTADESTKLTMGDIMLNMQTFTDGEFIAIPNAVRNRYGKITAKARKANLTDIQNEIVKVVDAGAFCVFNTMKVDNANSRKVMVRSSIAILNDALGIARTTREPLDRGNAMHVEARAYYKDGTRGNPFSDYLMDICPTGAMFERCVNGTMKRTDAIIITDNQIDIVEFKTGGTYPWEHMAQVMGYADAIKLEFGGSVSVKIHIVYSDMPSDNVILAI